MTYHSIDIQQETPKERIDRLVRSVEWMDRYGSPLDCFHWRAHLAKAERGMREFNRWAQSYILHGDFISVLIGPFRDIPQAMSHMAFMRQRDLKFGPQAQHQELFWLTPEDAHNYANLEALDFISMEEDLAYDPMEGMEEDPA